VFGVSTCVCEDCFCLEFVVKTVVVVVVVVVLVVVVDVKLLVAIVEC
jgi:hypothetical protein